MLPAFSSPWGYTQNRTLFQTSAQIAQFVSYHAQADHLPVKEPCAELQCNKLQFCSTYFWSVSKRVSHPHLETMPPAPATNLVFFQPLLRQLFAALLQHRAAQLHRLVLVELALVQQDAKVLQQRRRGARSGRHLLESLNGLRGAQDSLQNPDSQVCHTVKL